MHKQIAAIALSLSLVSPALAAPRCAAPADQAAFEVQALRSELMVLATGCHEDVKYNAFMHRFQPDLQANERAINAYFQHRGGQTAHDRFVTELANALSRQGADMGTDFCPRNGLMFNETAALPAVSMLPEYVAGKGLIPTSVQTCATAPAQMRRMAHARSR